MARKGKRRRKAPTNPLKQLASAFENVTLEGVTDLISEARGFVDSVRGAMEARAGQAQAPAQNASAPPQSLIELQWAAGTLGLIWPTTTAAVRDAHKKMAMLMHPDRGGDPSMAKNVNVARDTLLRALGAA